MGKAAVTVTENDGQDLTGWKPTLKQQAVLEVARTGTHRTISAICNAAGVSRQAYHGWIKDDAGFADAWNSIWRGAAQNAMPLVVAAMVRKAVKGDTQAARLVAEIAEATRTKDFAAFQNLHFEVKLVGSPGFGPLSNSDQNPLSR